MYPKYPGFCRWRETMEALPTVQRFRASLPPRAPIEHAQGVGRVASPEILRGRKCPEHPSCCCRAATCSGFFGQRLQLQHSAKPMPLLPTIVGDQGRSVGFTVEGGSIHVKSGLLPGSHLAFASKVNVNLPENAKLRGLPTIQGIVVVSDAKDGRPLAVMGLHCADRHPHGRHGGARGAIRCPQGFDARSLSSAAAPRRGTNSKPCVRSLRSRPCAFLTSTRREPKRSPRPIRHQTARSRPRRASARRSQRRTSASLARRQSRPS